MRQALSPARTSLLDDLRRLRSAARVLLDVASPAAREEWNKLEQRLGEDQTGIGSLSEAELIEVNAKVRRFLDILKDLAAQLHE